MEYKGQEIITKGYPKPMLVWDNDERQAIEELVFAELKGEEYPFLTKKKQIRDAEVQWGGEQFRHTKPIPEFDYSPYEDKPEYPKVMRVSNSPITEANPGLKIVVWAENRQLTRKYFTYDPTIQSLKDLTEKSVSPGEAFRHAVDYIEPDIELTLEEIADKFNIDVNKLKIKK